MVSTGGGTVVRCVLPAHMWTHDLANGQPRRRAKLGDATANP